MYKCETFCCFAPDLIYLRIFIRVNCQASALGVKIRIEVESSLYGSGYLPGHRDILAILTV